MINLEVNGQDRQVDVADDTPLLWVIRETLGLTGTKFGRVTRRVPGMDYASRSLAMLADSLTAGHVSRDPLGADAP